MFDIDIAVKQNKLFEQAKICGLPYKPKQSNPQVEHISGDDIDNQAISEAVYMKRSFMNKTMNFGKRLRKRKGEKHRDCNNF